MAHSHSLETGLTPAGVRRHRRALKVMLLALIPLAVWTIAGLIVFWPHHLSAHIAPDSSAYTVVGTTYPKARITSITPISCEGAAGSTSGASKQTCATVGAQLLSGPDRGQTVQVTLTDAVYGSGTKVGQQITLIRLPAAGDQPVSYQFSDFVRSTPLLVLTLVFAAAVILVARWRGLASLIGLAYAGFILVTFMFPALVSGTNPLVVGLIGSSAIMFVALYAAHGFSARTTTALLGTLAGLILIATLGYLFSRWAHLTGVTAEDDYVLSASAPDLRLTSVVICGLIIAGLGVLGEVTVTQASAVWELADADPHRTGLFASAMRSGRDHIASSVYILAFATAGAVLPVLLLVTIYDRPLLDILTSEQFAGDVIRVLVASTGLVLAVPLTTAIAVGVVRASRTGRKPSTAKTPPAGPVPDDSATEPVGPKPVVIRKRRHNRNEFDDLDYSDLRDPSDDVAKIRRQR